MKTKLLIIPLIFIYGCHNRATTQIAENTFVYESKIYKLIDNELTEIYSLDADSIRTLDVLKPRKKELGITGLNFVKPGAKAAVDALYRGNFLYYKITITGLNDLKENYNPGRFTLSFQDEFGFDLHSLEIPTNFLIGILDENGQVYCYEFKSKFEISTEINAAIQDVSMSSTVKKRGSEY